MADQLEQISEHLRPYLDDGEQPIAAMTAAPRGKNTQIDGGGVGGVVGGRMGGGQVKRAESAGLRLDSNMAVVLTDHRLLALKVKFTMGGAIKGVEQLLGAVPLREVDSVGAQRVGLGGNLVLTLRGGEPIKLECRVGRAREMAEA